MVKICSLGTSLGTLKILHHRKLVYLFQSGIASVIFSSFFKRNTRLLFLQLRNSFLYLKATDCDVNIGFVVPSGGSKICCLWWY